MPIQKLLNTLPSKWWQWEDAGCEITGRQHAGCCTCRGKYLPVSVGSTASMLHGESGVIKCHKVVPQSPWDDIHARVRCGMSGTEVGKGTAWLEEGEGAGEAAALPCAGSGGFVPWHSSFPSTTA